MGGRRFVTPGRRALAEGLGQLCAQRLDGSRDSAIHTKYRDFATLFIGASQISVESLLDFTLQHCLRTNTVSGLAKAGRLVECSLTLFVPGFGDIRKLCV
ncbi:hypothetical protein Bca52824_096292 [Brassica carinata]|uniref:Uncharacterized protein n=1 Tax=Brassica carinata TaxID=52824 RepID=A0A8X7NZR4_BRACI|nr:hypothetical protein Bca52824_096292 [Brassica carinata]